MRANGVTSAPHTVVKTKPEEYEDIIVSLKELKENHS